MREAVDGHVRPATLCDKDQGRWLERFENQTDSNVQPESKRQSMLHHPRYLEHPFKTTNDRRLHDRCQSVRR